MDTTYYIQCCGEKLEIHGIGKVSCDLCGAQFTIHPKQEAPQHEHDWDISHVEEGVLVTLFCTSCNETAVYHSDKVIVEKNSPACEDNPPEQPLEHQRLGEDVSFVGLINKRNECPGHKVARFDGEDDILTVDELCTSLLVRNKVYHEDDECDFIVFHRCANCLTPLDQGRIKKIVDATLVEIYKKKISQI